MEDILWVGIVASFIGALPPGMINIGMIDSTIRRGLPQGILFAIGVSLVEILQVFIAVLLINIFLELPHLEDWLAVATIPIFLYFAYSYYTRTAESPDGQVENSKSGIHPLLKGMLVSTLNMLAIPFWVLWGGIFIRQGVLHHDHLEILVFSISVALGTFLSLLAYGILAHYIRTHFYQFSSVLNKVVALIFLVLAVMLLYSIF